MAEIAAFAHVNVAARQFERRIGPHPVDFSIVLLR